MIPNKEDSKSLIEKYGLTATIIGLILALIVNELIRFIPEMYYVYYLVVLFLIIFLIGLHITFVSLRNYLRKRRLVSFKDYKRNLVERLKVEPWYKYYSQLYMRPIILTEFGRKDIRVKKFNISDAVEKYQYLFIFGAPGSGKTISLKKLLMEYANKNGPIPVFIELIRSKGESLENLIIRNICSETQIDEIIIKEKLRKGDFLILLDGLDEVPTSCFQLTQDIDNPNPNISKNRFVVTSRPSPMVGKLDRYTVMEIEPLEEPLIRELLRKHIGDFESEEIYNKIKMNEALYDLCTNPLMLTMMVDTYKSNKKLPDNTTELYENFINVFLTMWERKHIKEKIEIIVDDILIISSNLAYEMQRNHQTIIKWSSAKDIMEKKAKELGYSIEFSNEIIQYILNTNLIQKIDTNEYKFMHQTFQEYFAARYIEKEGITIDQYLDDPNWAPVVVFYSGLIGDSTNLVKALQKRNLDLAAKCIKIAKKVDRKVVYEVIRSIILRYCRYRLEPVKPAPEIAVFETFGIKNIGVRAIDSLLELVERDDNPLVRALSVFTLAENFSMDKRIIDPLITRLNDDNDHVRYHIFDLLVSRLNEDKVAIALIPYIDDMNCIIRAYIVYLLRKINTQRIKKLITHHFENSDLYMQKYNNLPDIERLVVKELIDRLKTSKDPEELHHIVDVLAILGTENAVESLIYLLRDKNWWMIRSRSARALGYIGDKRAVEPLIECLHDDDYDVRYFAVRSLEKIGDERAIPYLNEVAQNDKIKYIRISATEAIDKIKKSQ